MPVDSPQPFTSHLEELRIRIIYVLASIAIVSIAAYFFVDPILEWLAKPVGEFVFTTPAEAFLVRLKLAGGIGVVISFPVLLYHAWRFTEIALGAREKSLLLGVLPAAYLLFLLGVAIALFGVAPLAMKFLLEFGTPTMRPMISISAYLSFLFWMIIGFGALFQLPIGVVGLCRLGLVQAATLAQYRKHVLVGLFIVAAVLTPGPDVVSQLLLALPGYLLFEISLILGRLWQKNVRVDEND